MKARTTVGILLASTLSLTSVYAMAQGHHGHDGADAIERAQVERGQRDFDRDRMRDHDRAHDPVHDRMRDRDQDRTHAPDDAQMSDHEIYGSELMSEQEHRQYREQLRLTESDPEAHARFMQQHQEKMQLRAMEHGEELPDPPADDGAD